MGNFAANLKREIFHMKLTDLETPPPPLVGLEVDQGKRPCRPILQHKC